MKKQKLIKYLLYCMVFSSLVACDDKLYNKWQDIPQFQWNKTNKIVNEIDAVDGTYEFKIGLRHLAELPYKSVKILLETTSPSGKVDKNEIDFKIRDENNGLIGEVMSELVDTEQVVDPGFTFKEKGKYKFVMTHLMAGENFGGVLEVGLIIKPKK